MALDNQSQASPTTSRSLIQSTPIRICSGGLKEPLFYNLCRLHLQKVIYRVQLLWTLRGYLSLMGNMQIITSTRCKMIIYNFYRSCEGIKLCGMWKVISCQPHTRNDKTPQYTRKSGQGGGGKIWLQEPRYILKPQLRGTVLWSNMSKWVAFSSGKVDWLT